MQSLVAPPGFWRSGTWKFLCPHGTVHVGSWCGTCGGEGRDDRGREGSSQTWGSGQASKAKGWKRNWWDLQCCLNPSTWGLKPPRQEIQNENWKTYVHAGWQPCFVGSLCSTAWKGVKIWKNGVNCFNILNRSSEEGALKDDKCTTPLLDIIHLTLEDFKQYMSQEFIEALKNVESCVPFPLWRRPTQHIQMRRLLKSPGVLYDLLTCFIFQGRMVFWLLAACSSCSYLSLQEEKHPILKTLIRNIVWSQALSDFTLETIWHPLPLWILTCRNAKKWMSPLICIVLFFFLSPVGRFLLTLLLLRSSWWILQMESKYLDIWNLLLQGSKVVHAL